MICLLCAKEEGDVAMPCPQPLPLAPATYAYLQDWGELAPPSAYYLLTADVPGHCKGSHVSERTLTRLGYRLPERHIV